ANGLHSAGMVRLLAYRHRRRFNDDFNTISAALGSKAQTSTLLRRVFFLVERPLLAESGP
ncbi:MAG: hypothetical protein O7B24_13985, partial [Alphaproteobacteria bacterium]|nr:hypothetical protein [Alphaproteobacteria bacterium]